MLKTLAKKYQDNSQQTTLDSDYSTGDVSYVEDEYPEYTYDASDMDYIMRRRDNNPTIYKNSLYPRADEYRNTSNNFLSSLFNRRKKSQNNGLYPANLYNYDYNRGPSWFDRLQPILSNPFVTIFLVVAVSYLLSFILGKLLKINSGIAGLIEMVVALLLSYGLTYMFADRSRFFITRGTVIFFISLIILIILIFV